MNRRGRLWSAATIAALPLLACSLSGCGLAGPTTNAASPAKPTAAPAHVSISGLTGTHVYKPGAAAGGSITGAWVFKDKYTNEVLHLRQGKGSAVSGNGQSAVKDTKGKLDHSSIDVHTGRVTGRKLTLSLYVAQLDWGTGVTVVENLRCAVTPRVLHCRMDLPLYANVRNVPQDFVRRA